MANIKFYYHLGLHYSQTVLTVALSVAVFYYHLGLHYSQTQNQRYTV